MPYLKMPIFRRKFVTSTNEISVDVLNTQPDERLGSSLVANDDPGSEQSVDKEQANINPTESM